MVSAWVTFAFFAGVATVTLAERGRASTTGVGASGTFFGLAVVSVTLIGVVRVVATESFHHKNATAPSKNTMRSADMSLYILLWYYDIGDGPRKLVGIMTDHLSTRRCMPIFCVEPHSSIHAITNL